nr:cuticle protein 21-like [Leptinotarsa decemlineata]
MISKVLAVAFLAVFAQAAHHDNHAAISTVSFNNNHNTVHHIHSEPSHHFAPSHGYSAPAPQYGAPVAHYAVPAVKVASPAVVKYTHTAPAPSIVSHYSAPVAHHAVPVAHYSAPVTKIAAPVVVKTVSAHHVPSVHQFAPVTKYVAPVAKVVAPVAHAHVAPAVHHQAFVPAFVKSVHHEEEYAPAKYEFAYGVEDHQTGDIHSHKESRDGDITHGEYSLHDADGTIRTVKYTVEKHSGFNAVVERSGHAHPAPAVKTLVAAPHHYHH